MNKKKNNKKTETCTRTEVKIEFNTTICTCTAHHIVDNK